MKNAFSPSRKAATPAGYRADRPPLPANARRPRRSTRFQQPDQGRTPRPKLSPAPLVPEQVAACCRALAVPVPPDAIPPLTSYLDLLLRWNTAMNLTGARDWREALTRLVADSFHLAGFLATLPLPARPQVWDLGAGAGLPGIPLRMVWQCGDYTMIEAREKRAAFLATALAQLALPRTHMVHERVESFFARQARPADLILSRAFLPWQELLKLLDAVLTPQRWLVVLALTPAPPLPPGWHCRACHRYPLGETQRFFWALQRQEER